MPSRGRILATAAITTALVASCGGGSAHGGRPSTTLNAEQVQRYLSTFVPGPAPGPPTTVVGGPDPCVLVRVGEIERIVGEAVQEPTHNSGTECVWRLPKASPVQATSVAVAVSRTADADAAAAYLTKLRAVWPDIILRKPNVGDAAFWYSLDRGTPGQVQDLWARAGPYVLTIFAYEYDDAVAVAKLVVARLPRA